jgi:PAS domain-containing protein
VRFMANPFVMRAGVVLFFGTFACLMGLIFIRLLRKSIEDEAAIETDIRPTPETLPLHVYNTVIQQLTQQKQELIAQSQAEQNRSRTSEMFSQTVLSNLSCGVLVFGTNGLIKSGNPAAKEILGFASINGMSAEDIFRGALVSVVDDNSQNDETFSDSIGLADEVAAVLREGSGRRQTEAEYETPAGENRHIAVTICPVHDVEGNLLGAACMINDLGEHTHSEIPAEMASQLRASLKTISGYAQQLANTGDAEALRQIAKGIVQEAAGLDRNLGSFLAEKNIEQRATAAAGN